jgi:hypothetical protein
MNYSRAIATTAMIAGSAAYLAPAMADGARYRSGIASPRLYAKKVNPGAIRYYNVCGYGDCACLRARALATGSQVWWDRFQACTG